MLLLRWRMRQAGEHLAGSDFSQTRGYGSYHVARTQGTEAHGVPSNISLTRLNLQTLLPYPLYSSWHPFLQKYWKNEQMWMFCFLRTLQDPELCLVLNFFLGVEHRVFTLWQGEIGTSFPFHSHSRYKRLFTLLEWWKHEIKSPWHL